MNKLQAAMRDKAAKGWREARLYYRVGSCFKGCAHCGQLEERGGRMIFVTGLNVFRSYQPAWVKWTYRCWDCGATDALCWKDAWDIGKEPKILPREEMVRWRKEQRKLREEGAEPREVKLSERDRHIMQLEARIVEIKQMLGVSH